MVLAGFFKHSLWAIPMTALLWLAWQDGARALRAVLFSAALAAAGLAGCLALWGPDFLWNLAAPREATLWRGFIMLGRLQMIAPAIVLWGFWLYARRGTQTARFSALFLGLAFVVYIVQVRASGVDVNSQFELLVATAIALGLAVEGVDDIRLGRHVGVERVRHWILALLVLRLLASTQFAPFQILVSPTYRSSLAEQVAVTESEIARVAGLPDPVSCSIPTVCFRAGRAFAYDGFLMHQRVTTGAWSLGQLRAAVNAKGLRFETVDPRTEWDRDAMPALLGMILRKPPRKPAIALPRDLSEAQ
jgi:hypothetical protein